jgi:hypothetical protein
MYMSPHNKAHLIKTLSSRYRHQLVSTQTPK